MACPASGTSFGSSPSRIGVSSSNTVVSMARISSTLPPLKFRSVATAQKIVHLS